MCGCLKIHSLRREKIAVPSVMEKPATAVPLGVPLLSGMQVCSQKSAIQTVNGVQFQIIGDDNQMVETMLMPQQIMRCEPGTMVHMVSKQDY